MKLKQSFATGAACCALLSGAAHATPLSLDYVVTNLGGGYYDYDFKLTLDNHDNSWAAGQGWTWLVFGDARRDAVSPLSSFVMDPSSQTIGPWRYNEGRSMGDHNGPVLLWNNTLDDVAYWTPGAVGDYLTWSGTATVDLSTSGLLFSALGTTNGGVAADFEMANANHGPLVAAPIPEPETYAMMLAGLGLLGVMARRRKQKLNG